MPSTRFEARNQARAIPLVTVSLASRHHQTRLANDIERSTIQSQDHSQEDQECNSQGQPPSYDSIHQRGSSSSAEVVTQSPSNKDLTEAVLHLSRTLVSTSTAIPKHSTGSSWLFMMIYSWTHTQQTATHLYHILTKPSTFLKEIRSQNDQTQLQQYKRQRKSIQQMTEEQDMMEDDPDMLNNATEMISVNMMNTRSVASMEESLPDDPQEQEAHGDSSDDDLTIPGKPRRKIDKYTNPFGTGVNSEDELEDDEGWLGMGEERSEDGYTKTNSVLLTSTALSDSLSRRAPEFPSSSLGLAMDPRQFENEANIPSTSFPKPSLFNTPRSAIIGNPSTKTSQTIYSTNAGVNSSLTITSSTISRGMEHQHQQQLNVATVEPKYDQNDSNSMPSHLQSYPSLLESPWSESSGEPHDSDSQLRSLSRFSETLFSTTATAGDLSSTAISTGTFGYSMRSSSPLPSSSISSSTSISSLSSAPSPLESSSIRSFDGAIS
ncbi:hypothetical protein BGX27_001195 [Mortierella sp. AM989]|nr:hypothetical protein BGX27_001195 [Mortierella sp. AM989]